jgi:nitrite reductase (NO-forming)/hydroxylamine reductase
LIDDTEKIKASSRPYAVHISRLLASGRYVYVIGRDGRVLDRPVLEKPAVVAEVKIAFDALDRYLQVQGL